MEYCNTEGSHKCIVVAPKDRWCGKTKNGAKFLQIALKVIEGPESGKYLFAKLWRTDKGMEHLIKTLVNAFKMPGGWLELEENPTALINRECIAVTEISGSYCNVRRILPIEDEEQSRMENNTRTSQYDDPDDDVPF